MIERASLEDKTFVVELAAVALPEGEVLVVNVVLAVLAVPVAKGVTLATEDAEADAVPFPMLLQKFMTAVKSLATVAFLSAQHCSHYSSAPV